MTRVAVVSARVRMIVFALVGALLLMLLQPMSAQAAFDASLTVKLTSKSGAALTGVTVTAVLIAPGGHERDPGYADEVATSLGGGVYRFGDDVNDGLYSGSQYALYFDAPSSTTTAFDQYYGGASQIEDADYVYMLPGDQSLDVSLATNATFTGSVKSSAKKAIAGVKVIPWIWKGGDDGFVRLTDRSTTTSASGAYTLRNLEPGNYSLEFAPANSSGYVTRFTGGSDRPYSYSGLSLGLGQTVTSNATLPSGGTINGTLALQGGAVPDNLVATAYPVSNVVTRELIHGRSYSSAPTTSTGKYTIKGLPTGFYVIRFTDNDELYATRWSVNHAARVDSDVVPVIAGNTAGVALTTLVPFDDPASDTRVSFHLQEAGGSAVSNATILIQSSDGGSYSHLINQVPVGFVLMKSIPAGTYDIFVDPGEPSLAPYIQSGFVVSPAAGIDEFSHELGVAGSFTYLTPPSIAETAMIVGTNYQVDDGSYSMIDAPVTTTYQWYRGEIPIKGATLSHYKATVADVSFTLSVAVKAQRFGYAPLFTMVTGQTIAFAHAPGALVLPSIVKPGVGDPLPGEVLKVNLGTWDVDRLAYSYQWFVQGVQRGTGATYTVRPLDSGYEISLIVTATGVGRPVGSENATGSPTAGYLAAPVNTKVPTVSSTRAGQVNATKYTATGGTWSPAADSYMYEWFLGASALGVGGSTYVCPDTTCTPGSVLEVVVFAFKAGHYPEGLRVNAKKSSVATGILATGYAETPAVSGALSSTTPVPVGSVITAYPEVLDAQGLFDPAFTPAFKWQTSTNGTTWSTLAGKTAATYTVPSSIVGKKLRVLITTSSNAFPSHVDTIPVGIVKNKLDLVNSPANIFLDSAGPAGVTVKARTDTPWPVAGVTQKYQWYMCNRPVNGAACDDTSILGQSLWPKATGASTGQLYFVPVSLDGWDIYVVVTGSKSGYEPKSVASGPSPISGLPGAVGAPYPLEFPKISGTVSGNAVVGTKLKITGAQWNDPDTVVSRFWQYCPNGSDCSGGIYDPDWVAIPGTIALTEYTPTATDLANGTSIRYLESGSHGGGGTAPSAAMPLVAGTLKASKAPTVAYNATTHLATVNPGTWPAGTVLTYHWGDGLGTPFANTNTATSSSTPFYVDIEANLPGFTPLYTRLVAHKFNQTVNSVPLAGDTYGDSLSVDLFGLFTLPFSDTITTKWQWYSGSTPIKGATSEFFTPSSSYVGKSLKVRVTMSSELYTTKSAFSNPVTLLKHPAPSAPSVTMTGPSVDFFYTDVLSAAKSGYPSGSTFTYRWQRLVGGVWTTVGTKATYTVQAADIAQDLRVGVISKKTGWVTSPEIFSSSQTVAVAAQVKPATAFTIGTDLHVGSKITVTGEWNQPGVVSTYTWYLDGSELPGVTTSSWTPLASAYNASVYVVVTGNKTGHSGYDADTNDRVIGLGLAPTASTKPAISGMTGSGSPKAPKVGNTLKATTGSWNVDGLTYFYQWTLDGVAISGATANSYVVQASDATHVIAVQASAEKTGWDSGSTTSSNLKPVQP